MKGADMSDLKTKYIGLELRNPVIVASSRLTKDIDGLKKLEDAGAGGLVLKSLFEEQIIMEKEELESQVMPASHTEAYDYVSRLSMELGPKEYIRLIEDAKKSISIPVIASLNCVSAGWWIDYAKQLESAGADGLELNIGFIGYTTKHVSGDIEKVYYEIVQKVNEAVSLPIAVKVGSSFTSLPWFADQLSKRGCKALVLFNRYYSLDFDIEKMKVVPGNPLSTPLEMSLPLRWIALLYGRVECDLSATTGVHSGADVVKQLLAGASAVQICSVLYKKGPKYIETILQEIETWMKSNKFDVIDDFRGRLSQEESDEPAAYERLQYIKALVGIE